jgi:hypothetical protein
VTYSVSVKRNGARLGLSVGAVLAARFFPFVSPWFFLAAGIRFWQYRSNSSANLKTGAFSPSLVGTVLLVAFASISSTVLSENPKGNRATIPDAIPANDLCPGAEVIPGAGPFPYLTSTIDLTDATITNDPPAPSCVGTVLSRSVWYHFTPAMTGDYTILSCASGTGTTVSDTFMAIYTTSTGTCGGVLTEVPTTGPYDGCDDDSCGNGPLQAGILTRLDAGTNYFIVVWKEGANAPLPGSSALQLRINQVPVSPNDTCAGAIDLPLNTAISGTTFRALDDYELSGAACFTGIGQTASVAAGRDVLYSFTAPAANTYSFRVTEYDAGGGFGGKNLVLYVASSCPAATPGTPVVVSTCLGAANRTGVSFPAEEVFCVSLTANQTVFIFVDEQTLTSGSDFTIEATVCRRETEPNNTPATATTFVSGAEGSITPSVDVDFFSLGTPAAGSRLFAIVDGNAGNNDDFDLRVTTSTDTLEYDEGDAAGQFGGNSPTVAGTPLTGTLSFLRINALSAAVVSEPYRVHSVVQPLSASAVVEAEPNDTRAQANTNAVNYFFGSLSGPAPSADQDLFRFTAAAGDLIFLSLDGDPSRNNTPINARLGLLDGSGALLFQVNDPGQTSNTVPSPGTLTGTTPFSPGESLLFRAQSSGNFYAAVSIGSTSTSGIGTGDYLLSIAVFPRIIRLIDTARSGNDFVITFEALAGNSYRLERKTEITDAWESAGVSDLTVTVSGAAVITHPGGVTGAKAFYRVRLLP